MEIGGVDIWLEGPASPDDVSLVLRGAQASWPLAVVELADGTYLGLISEALKYQWVLPSELFIYLNADALDAWDNLGRTDYNAEHVIYCIVQHTCVTIVSEGTSIELAQRLLCLVGLSRD
jgi:hypothetical protein